MRRLVALTALALVVTGALAAAGSSSETQLGDRLAGALAVPGVSRAHTGALAIDLRAHRVVYALNPALPLAPASNEKLTVTFAALVRLGPGFRFHTQVLATGRRDGATWRGNVYLRGGGDPTLTVADLRALAVHLRHEGIRRIAGNVLADESRFDKRRMAPGWKPEFWLHESPPLSALVVARATFDHAMSPDPAGAAAAIFVRQLDRAGVHVAGHSAWGTAPRGARELGRIASAPLWRILQFMDRWSDNFRAEMVLKTLGHGTTAGGAEAVVHTLAAAHVPLRGVRIADGSGLSSRDRLTARAIGAILVAAWQDRRIRSYFWHALAVAGRTGTLADRLDSAPARGAIHAKTGTTDIASALSGYARDRYVFSVVQDGEPIATWPARAAQDRFASVLAAAAR